MGREDGEGATGRSDDQTGSNPRVRPDGRYFAHVDGPRIQLIPVQPDEEELAYRRLHTRPSVQRYWDGYSAAQVAKDAFAARFYLDRLIDLSTAMNQPDEVKRWRTERAKYPDIASPPREKN